MVAIDIYRMEKSTMEVGGYHKLFSYENSSKILFCVQQKKETHTGLEQFEGE